MDGELVFMMHEKIADKLKKMDKFIKNEMNYWHIPGCTIALIENNEVVFLEAFGKNNLEANSNMRVNTVFPIGSCIKSFTSIAVGMLIDKGILDWDKPIIKYVHNFKMDNPYATKHMTLRDILTHRSGLCKNTLLWDFSPLSREGLFKRLHYLQSLRNINPQYSYNNLMYSIVEYIIEHLSGIKFEEYLMKNILNTLEMKNTTTSLKDLISCTQRVYSYDYVDEEYRSVFYDKDLGVKKIGFTLNSTAEDLAKWILLYLNMGKHKDRRLISQESLFQGITPQTTIRLDRQVKSKEKLNMSYGMGWFIQSYRGHQMAFHEGCSYGSNAFLSFLPDDNIGLVILSNIEHPKFSSIITYNIYDRLLCDNELDWSTYYRENFKPKKCFKENTKISLSNNDDVFIDKSKFVGVFENSGYGAVNIEELDDSLMFRYYSLNVPLQYYMKNQFIAIPTSNYISMRNKLGYNNSLIISFDESKNTMFLHNELEAKNIVFKRK